MTESHRVASAAARLFAAQRDRAPIRPLTVDWRDLDERTAYEVQRATLALTGQRRVGFKLGYTSEAMRAQMKVSTPNYGVLLAHTRVDDGDGMIESAELIHPLAEPEIAVTFGRDVLDPANRDTIAEAIDAVMPAIEIVDTRYERYEFTAPDNIADNSSAARFIVGAPKSPAACADLRTIVATIGSDGRTLARGIGSDVMGDPLNALVWFCNRRLLDGEPVRAGDIVLTGGMTRAQACPPGTPVIAEFSGGLGMVKAHFSAAG